MAYSLSISQHKTAISALVAIILCAISYPTLWPRSVSAQNELKLRLTLNPASPLKDKGTLTVTDLSNDSRQFNPANFKLPVTTDPVKIVDVTPSTTSSVFEVTPLKSGKTKVTIEYTAEEQRVLKGETTIVVPYRDVYLEVFGADGQPQKIKKDETLKLFSGQKKSFKVFGTDIKSGTASEIPALLKVPNDKVVGFIEGEKTIVAKDVERTAKESISIEVDGVAYGPFNVEVTEAIKQIKIVNDKVDNDKPFTLPIAEGEKKDLTIQVVGVKGTIFKSSEVGLEVTRDDPQVERGEPLPPLGEFVAVSREEDTLHLTARELTVNTRGTQIITLKVPQRGKGDIADGGNPSDISTKITVIVTQKAGTIKLTPTSPALTQNGRVGIKADVYLRNNAFVPVQPIVKFTLKNPAKDDIWVTLVEAGSNQATLVWRNPTPDEIRAKNNNPPVPRPSDVVVVAETKLNSDGEPIKSEISISVGEIRGFDYLTVKLNLMDERTVADLYGKVTSDDYYVLTVRLFNNLKNERQELTGNSILAYSSSIEVAVGLEKKFDAKGSDSYFSSVISKSEADKLAKKRADNAVKLATKRADDDFATATTAQQTLTDAIKNQYEMRQKAIKAVAGTLERKAAASKRIKIARATKKTTDIESANNEINQYNSSLIDMQTALEAAKSAEANVEKLRVAAARAASANRAMLSQDIAEYVGPDTAIDDGKWHPLTRYDLSRISPLPEPTPPSEDELEPLDVLTEDSLKETPRGATNAAPVIEPKAEKGADEAQDPPCVGVITYRPFTFEMMVNTVDRRDNRSTRSKVFKVLDFIGTGTSFVTSFAVPGPGSDLPLGLEKYRNLLLPGLDKLYPNFKEQQRQNIVSQAMKEIEEIPFGSDITRVIFIPKKAIHGLIRGHDVRISEICPFFFRIQVAIITKSGVSQTGAIVQ